ncbi:MAG: hypothetical protein AAB864_01715 [Patescibacteria group bacterium]
MQYVPVTYYIRPEEVEALKKIAKKSQRSGSAVVRIMIQKEAKEVGIRIKYAEEESE